MGFKSNPKPDSNSKPPQSLTAEELVLQLQTSFFAHQFQSVAKTLMEREQNLKDNYLNLKKKSEEEKSLLISELKKKEKEVDEMRKMKDEFEGKFRVCEKRCLELEDKVLGLEKMGNKCLGSRCCSFSLENMEQKDGGGGDESCSRSPLFSEADSKKKSCSRSPLFSEADSKKKVEPNLPVIIEIDDDDDDKVDQRRSVPTKIKRECNTDDDDDLKYISTTKKRRVSNEIERDHHGESAVTSQFLKKVELDSSASDSGSESVNEVDKLYMSSSAKLKKQKEGWGAESDMVKDLEKDDKLCLNGVCALHRQKVILHGTDICRMSELACMLIDGDPHKMLMKKASELNQFDLDQCRMFAKKYALQLFNIYQEKRDPFFPTSRSQEQRSDV